MRKPLLKSSIYPSNIWEWTNKTRSWRNSSSFWLKFSWKKVATKNWTLLFICCKSILIVCSGRKRVHKASWGLPRPKWELPREGHLVQLTNDHCYHYLNIKSIMQTGLAQCRARPSSNRGSPRTLCGPSSLSENPDSSDLFWTARQLSLKLLTSRFWGCFWPFCNGATSFIKSFLLFIVFVVQVNLNPRRFKWRIRVLLWGKEEYMTEIFKARHQW